jgi:hypothetical protein
MRRIKKCQVPECLQAFIDGQLAIEPEPVNLTYEDFRGKAELMAILTDEQFGLCGYTGAPVDERVSQLKAVNAQVIFANHIEHLKCQKTCREELNARGRECGRDLGEDLDYLNLIAALEVRGAETERFGAVIKANKRLPILPTQEGCNERFVFRENDGGTEGLDDEANTSIAVLALNHDTLKDWRSAAIAAWLDPNIVQTLDDFQDVLRVMTEPRNKRLPEYAYVIESIARQYLNEAHV